MSRPLTRLAAADGVEHVSAPRASRTFCGRLVTDPRHAWPRRSRCPVCLAEAERLLHAQRDAS